MALRQFVRTTAPKMGLQGSIPALSTSIARNYSTGEKVFRFPPDPSPPIFACFLSLPWRSCEDARAPLRYPQLLATDIFHAQPFVASRSHRRPEVYAVSRGKCHERPKLFPPLSSIGQNTKHAFPPKVLSQTHDALSDAKTLCAYSVATPCYPTVGQSRGRHRHCWYHRPRAS